ncbi:MAG: DUF502 domain-containing protein [bacterium]|nr:DUF502 domain-containing protein [bacterium]
MTAWRSTKDTPKGFFGYLHRGWGQAWRTLVTGLLVWVPLIITIWVTWFFVSRFVVQADNLLRDLVENVKPRLIQFGPFGFLEEVNYPPGVGLVLVGGLFFGTGLLTRYLVGRRIIALGEKIVRVIPFVNRIYSAVQQIRDVFVGRQGAVFQKVCLVEYPREGMVAVAFVTSNEQGLVQRAVGKELIAVFVPTTPNPTSGYLVYLPPEEVRILDIGVEEAMKLIVSGGAYIPGQTGEQGDPPAESQPETDVPQ